MGSYLDAMYRSLLTVLTVGNATPGGTVTPDARIVTGLLTFSGIGLVGVASSRLTAWWLHNGDKDAAVLEEIHDVQVEIAVLRDLLLESGLLSGRHASGIALVADRPEPASANGQT